MSSPAYSKLVYLSLGSNLGDREKWLAQALRKLESPGLHLLRTSSIYETEPVDFRAQGWFLNLIAEAGTDLFPLQLLHRTSSIERALGRRRLAPKGPRTIDIDILLYANAIVDSPELTIPHPRLAKRRFVLEPLAELAPDLRHPVLKRTVRELLGEVSGQEVRKTGLRAIP